MSAVDVRRDHVLPDDEARRLHDAEQVIAAGLQTFVDVGTALAEIADDRLYRTTHATFEDYCRERWGLSRSYAYRQIEAAGVVASLSSIGDTPMPANVAQARELIGLDAATAVQVMTAVAGDGARITAARIREVRAKATGTTATAAREHNESDRAAPPRPRSRRPLPDAYRDCIEDLGKLADRLENLHADDRFAEHRQELEGRHGGTLDDRVGLLQDLVTELYSGVRLYDEVDEDDRIVGTVRSTTRRWRTGSPILDDEGGDQ